MILKTSDGKSDYTFIIASDVDYDLHTRVRDAKTMKDKISIAFHGIKRRLKDQCPTKMYPVELTGDYLWTELDEVPDEVLLS